MVIDMWFKNVRVYMCIANLSLKNTSNSICIYIIFKLLKVNIILLILSLAQKFLKDNEVMIY